MTYKAGSWNQVVGQIKRLDNKITMESVIWKGRRIVTYTKQKALRYRENNIRNETTLLDAMVAFLNVSECISKDITWDFFPLCHSITTLGLLYKYS